MVASRGKRVTGEEFLAEVLLADEHGRCAACAEAIGPFRYEGRDREGLPAGRCLPCAVASPPERCSPEVLKRARMRYGIWQSQAIAEIVAQGNLQARVDAIEAAERHAFWDALVKLQEKDGQDPRAIRRERRSQV